MDSDSELSDAPTEAPPTPGRAMTPITSPKPSPAPAEPARKSVRSRKPPAKKRSTSPSSSASKAVKPKPKLEVTLKKQPAPASPSPAAAEGESESADEFVLAPEPPQRKKAKARLIDSDSAPSSDEDQPPPKKAAKIRNSLPAKGTPTPTTKPKAVEARLRASLDQAITKAPPKPTKLNAQAPSFVPRPHPPPRKTEAQFGKNMSGWDQLFGTLSGVSTPPKQPATPQPQQSKEKDPPNQIRPQPLLDRLTPEQLRQKRAEESARNHDTQGCFDLLAHAEIMMAFEHEMIYEDRKMAASLRPSRFGAGFNLP